jgi:hypothetical protein
MVINLKAPSLKISAVTGGLAVCIFVYALFFIPTGSPPPDSGLSDPPDTSLSDSPDITAPDPPAVSPQPEVSAQFDALIETMDDTIMTLWEMSRNSSQREYESMGFVYIREAIDGILPRYLNFYPETILSDLLVLEDSHDRSGWGFRVFTHSFGDFTYRRNEAYFDFDQSFGSEEVFEAFLEAERRLDENNDRTGDRFLFLPQGEFEITDTDSDILDLIISGESFAVTTWIRVGDLFEYGYNSVKLFCLQGNFQLIFGNEHELDPLDAASGGGADPSGFVLTEIPVIDRDADDGYSHFEAKVISTTYKDFGFGMDGDIGGWIVEVDITNTSGRGVIADFGVDIIRNDGGYSGTMIGYEVDIDYRQTKRFTIVIEEWEYDPSMRVVIEYFNVIII